MKRQPISKAMKRDVWEKCGGRCWYCGIKIARPFFHFDHIYPHSRGGKNTVANLAVACIPCNISKKHWELWKWRIKIEKKLGLFMPRHQIDLLRSENIDPTDNPYIWEIPVLFFFERNKPKREMFGDCEVNHYIRFKGWQP